MADDIDDSLEEALAHLGYSDVLVSGGSRIFKKGGPKK